MLPELREGFTTGTAAAAATAAAVALLLDAPLPDRVCVALPPFDNQGRLKPLTARYLEIPIAKSGRSGLSAWASVIKDGGDDPDATHGAEITVHASKTAFDPDRIFEAMRQPDRDAEPRFRPVPEKGNVPLHARPVKLEGASGNIWLYSGQGVGTVTLPGLPVAVGEPAINPEPRKQIAYAAMQAARSSRYGGDLHLCITVPEGKERAERTLNARLGILGGISILGTSGTVLPYSHEAWKATISQGMSVASALGLPDILCSTGRRSERLGFSLYPGLAPQAGIQVADFAAHAVREAAAKNFKRILWVCFPGKLFKLAQGLEWTHAKTAAVDIMLLARYYSEAGGEKSSVGAIAGMPTVTGAFSLMASEPVIRDAVLNRMGRQALDVMHAWLERTCEDEGRAKPEIRLHVFSPEETLMMQWP